LGYADMASGQPVAGDPNTSGWQGPLHASRATIEEIHPSQRDGAMLTFPCFRTTAFYAPGMSGGPISSVDGRIIGVVSTSFDEGGTAYGALMAGILEANVRLPTDQVNVIALSFPDLIANGLVNTDGAEVSLDRTGIGVSLTWSE
jgi:S1-C subfamily serine protease